MKKNALLELMSERLNNRIDEKINFKITGYPATGSIDISTDADLEDLVVSNGKAGAGTSPFDLAGLESVADEETQNDELTDDDIKSALKQKENSTERRFLKYLAMYGKAKIRKRIFDIENKLVANNELTMSQLIPSDVDATGSQVGTDPFYMPNLDDVRSSQSPGGVFQDFSNFQAKAPQSVIHQFKAIEGAGLLAKFTTLQKFGEVLKGGLTEINKWVDGDTTTPGNGAFKFMNYAPAYMSLVDMAKKLSGNEAGYGWEKYLALLLGAPVVGAGNGAADNIASIAKGRKVYMSAKMLDFKSVGAIKQAIRGAEGVETVLKGADGKGGNPIYYLTVLKGTATQKTSETGFATIRLYLHRLYYIDGAYRVTLLDDAGNEEKDYEAKLSKDKSDVYIFEGEMDTAAAMDANSPGRAKPTFTLPAPVVPTGRADELLQMTSDYVADIAADGGTSTANNAIIKAVTDAYNQIDVMRKYSRSYVAQKTNTAQDNIDYVKKISDSYGKLKTAYITVFSGEKNKHTFTEAKAFANYLTQLAEEELKKII